MQGIMFSLTWVRAAQGELSLSTADLKASSTLGEVYGLPYRKDQTTLYLFIATHHF